MKIWKKVILFYRIYRIVRKNIKNITNKILKFMLKWDYIVTFTWLLIKNLVELICALPQSEGCWNYVWIKNLVEVDVLGIALQE